MEKEKKGKGGEISGWYSTERLSREERSARMEDIDAWYEKRHVLNYRTVPIELPGKMLAVLGKLALDDKVQFSEFVERIFEQYLTQRRIDWQQSSRMRAG